MSDPLQQALATALAHLLAHVDTCDDEVLDPDTAVGWTEHTAHALGRLAPGDRRRLDALLRQAALREPEGPWREALLRVPAGLGLAEDPYAWYCDAVEDHARRFAKTLRGADPAAPVPSCPGWTVGDLIAHYGTTHRWTAHMVRTLPTERVFAKDLRLQPPADPAECLDWAVEGAEAAVRALRAADPDAGLWSFGADRHVRAYHRRVLSESAVHLADAALAVGAEPRVEPATAADAVEEFLENLPHYGWIAEPVSRIGRDGATLRLTATDTGAAARTTWTITLGGGGFDWTRRTAAPGTTEPATVTVAGTAGELLLLLYGRYGADDHRFTVSGDPTLLDAWTSATAF
ncbi:maleylpyruvate isomerase family mycothiol-dependent enzyme [Streptomyces ficellus]|uniref:Maleylpyruvate isomerase family mycothiol-dependent enzyme n=1 Tax=Streptomyces ficellus TaxID=1977088 RepID=A0A6I6FQP8_9ACTN|nr:maleylpyruvate isomerase family mycothiol-dependent enzyme [Streptomyces ficellus]QGV81799.1 maleylpyruvate isomerase family mycothiol-dependent enzyme [Streptomyces ficellus]